MSIQIFLQKFLTISAMLNCLVLCGSGFASAQTQLPEGVPLFSIGLAGEYLPDLSFSDTDASVSQIRTEVHASFATLHFSYIRDEYQWDSSTSLPFNHGAEEPWETLQTLEFDGVYGGGLNEKWAYFLYADGTFSFEDALSDAYRFAEIGGGAQYQWNSNIQLFLGAGVTYDDIEEAIFDGFKHWTPYPVGGFRWNQFQNHGLAVSLILPQEANLSYRTEDQKFAALIGTNWALGFIGNLSYQLSSRIGIELDGQLKDGYTYRLADDTQLFTQQNGAKYVSGDYNIIEAAMTYQATPRFSIKAGPYYTFGRTLEIADNHDDSLADMDIDDAIGGKFSIVFAF